jgi:hypothetical protein
MRSTVIFLTERRRFILGVGMELNIILLIFLVAVLIDN